MYSLSLNSARPSTVVAGHICINLPSHAGFHHLNTLTLASSLCITLPTFLQRYVRKDFHTIFVNRFMFLSDHKNKLPVVVTDLYSSN